MSGFCIHTQRIVLATLVLSVVSVLFAWADKKQEDTEKDKLYLEHTDVLYADEYRYPGASVLVGNVKFRHGGMTLTCDSALYYERLQNFDAFGNVYMVQGDTLSLSCDELYYLGTPRLARARMNVVLTHRDSELTTDSLNYDRINSLGYFLNGGTMVDGENTLVSDYGEYNTETENAVFYYNVLFVNPRFKLENDTLYYNTSNEIAHAVGPSRITHENNKVYTENGYYYTKPDQMILLDRSMIYNAAREITADSMFWDNVGNWGEAFNNIVYTSYKDKNCFTGNYCYTNDSTGYSMATDSACAIDFSQRDSLYMHADTFKMFTHNIRTDSAYRLVHAYPHVRVYRIDMQAVADSAVLDERDSTLHMYKDPILWQDEQQVIGEEIIAFLNDSTLDSVHVDRQALTVERLDDVHYNQIAGHYIRIYFDEGKVRQTYVHTNVIVEYYPYDEDSLLIGLNYTESSELRAFFDSDQKIDRIWMPAATGTLYPMDQIPPNRLYLDNFAWFDYVRPVDKADIFNWRPKREGSKLKETVLHAPPLQTLDRFRKKMIPQSADTLAVPDTTTLPPDTLQHDTTEPITNEPLTQEDSEPVQYPRATTLQPSGYILRRT